MFVPSEGGYLSVVRRSNAIWCSLACSIPQSHLLGQPHGPLIIDATELALNAHKSEEEEEEKRRNKTTTSHLWLKHFQINNKAFVTVAPVLATNKQQYSW